MDALIKEMEQIKVFWNQNIRYWVDELLDETNKKKFIFYGVRNR
jgi:hypothetical protein